MRRWLCIFISAVFFVGCHGPVKDATAPDRLPVSKYIRRTNAETVVVFVPGVLGDAVSTWTSDTTGAYWPEMLTRDPTFKDSDVYTYSYSSARTQAIDEIVAHFGLRLTDDEVFQAHKRVIFVCHSLGGIVVRSYLLQYPNQAAQVPLVYLLSTPSTGAALSRLNPFVRGTAIKGTDNDYLASLNGHWLSAKLPTLTSCAYETKPLSGVIIVSRDDATALCNGQASPVDADHVTIAKPASPADASYVLFRRAFQENGLRTIKPAEKLVTETIVSAPVYFELGCAESRSFQYIVSPPRPLRPNERIVAATPSLQDVANLKDFQIRSVSYSAINSTVLITASGLDRDFTGNCRGGGHGRLVVTFVLTGPANQ